MPGDNGIEVARQLRARGFNLGILILTAFDDPPYIKAALDVGANGYVLKSANADELVEAVRSVYEGKLVLNTSLNIPPLEDSTNDPSLTKMTEREIDVLYLAAQGLTNKAIGFKLSISDRTVQGHLANIYEKLGVSSRTEAVTRAVQLNLINVK